jgi:RNA polymerase sigma factor (sigma-70 family)
VTGGSEESIDWSQLWRLYVDHSETFRGAIRDLRSSGLRLSDEDGRDYVHEFLLERAPKALRTFDPAKGNLGSWLFVVFRRFVLERLRAASRRSDLVKRMAVETATPEAVSSGADVLNVRAAMRRLPLDQRRAVRAYFREGERESWRRVAVELRVSRGEARRLVTAGLEELTRLVGLGGDR